MECTIMGPPSLLLDVTGEDRMLGASALLVLAEKEETWDVIGARRMPTGSMLLAIAREEE